jgi:hypothetical protein
VEGAPRGAQGGRPSPAAITLALLLTDEKLDSLEMRAGDGEIAGRGRPGGSDVASPQPAARHGETAYEFPDNAASPGGRPRMDGVMGWSRIRAVAKDRSRHSGTESSRDLALVILPIFPANAVAADGRPRVDGVICWSRC